MCHMCHTQELYLSGNQIGDAGVTALANACAGGAMANFNGLDLSNNAVSNKTKGTMQTAMSKISGNVHL